VQEFDPNAPVFNINAGASSTDLYAMILQDMTINGSNYAGILIDSAKDCQIMDNNINNNYFGVYALNAKDNLIEDNQITDNNYGVLLAKIHIFSENTALF
jgi:parallel beta-helix repeat protein